MSDAKVKTKTIVKNYKTLKQAERYQNLLYNKHEMVRLIKWPMFSEEGQYIWEVSTV